MMPLYSFYERISINANVRLVDSKTGEELYRGSVKSIPEYYSCWYVNDFHYCGMFVFGIFKGE